MALLHLIIHEPRLRPSPHPFSVVSVPFSIVLAVALPALGKEERQQETQRMNEQPGLEKASVNFVHVPLGRLTGHTSRKRT